MQRALNLGDKLPGSIMLNESHQCIARLKKIIRHSPLYRAYYKQIRRIHNKNPINVYAISRS